MCRGQSPGEPTEGSPPCRAWLLLRLKPCDACLAKDPGQRRDRRDRLQTHRMHLVVHADRPVVEPGSLQSSTHLYGSGLDLVGQLGRARPRTPRPRLKHRRRSVGLGALAELVEGLAGDAVLGIEGRDRATRGVLRPLRDRETDGGSMGSLAATAADSRPKCHHQRTRNCHRCPDAEPSPMSCDMTARRRRSLSDARTDVLGICLSEACWWLGGVEQGVEGMRVGVAAC